MYLIRNAKETDKPFIYATWLRGLYHGNEWTSWVDKDIFFSKYHTVLERLLASSVISVSCLEDDPDTIMGYAVFDSSQKRLHWVFVKKAWRKLGIAKSLIPKDIVEVSHLTALGKKLLPEGIKFNPFL